MIVHKMLPLTLACGILISASQPAKADVTLGQLATRIGFLTAATFGVNFAALYTIEKCYRHGGDKYRPLRAALSGTALIT